MLKEYNDAIDALRQSVDDAPTSKGNLRLITCHETKKEFSLAKEGAKEALKIARALKREKECMELLQKIDKLEKREAQRDREKLQKMKGFLIRGGK